MTSCYASHILVPWELSLPRSLSTCTHGCYIYW